MNKIGEGIPKLVWWLGAIILVFAVFWYLATQGLISFKEITFDTTTRGFDTIYGSSWKWMNYLFGGVPAWMDSFVGERSAVVVTIAMFLLIFITFSDILSAFSTFSQSVSWVSGFLLAVIIANLKGVVAALAVFVGIFGGIGGGLAVILGMFASFIAFFAVNWGIGSLGPWILRRKAMMLAQKSEIETEAGAREIGAAIKGMKTIGKSIKS